MSYSGTALQKGRELRQGSSALSARSNSTLAVQQSGIGLTVDGNEVEDYLLLLQSNLRTQVELSGTPASSTSADSPELGLQNGAAAGL